jgi:hypothetical protein
MRFMMIMLPNVPGIDEESWTPDAEAVGAMSKYNEELTKAGVLLALDGLQPPPKGARVSFADGSARVTDGPFAEAKEVIGGYAFYEVESKEEAVEWANRFMTLHQELWPGWEGETEIRQVMDVG